MCVKANGTIFGLLLALSASTYADFTDGVSAYQNNDYITALKEWMPLAEGGDATSQYNVGVMFREGQGLPQNYSQAMIWLLKSAEQGHADAQYSLGVMYHEGRGTPQDDKHAVDLYLMAAEQGHVHAQYNLGISYHEGQGVDPDFAKSIIWFRKAAEQGNADALNTMGHLYFKGEGVLYDYVLAYVYFDLATSAGSSEAAENQRVLGEKLSISQFTEAASLAPLWTVGMPLPATSRTGQEDCIKHINCSDDYLFSSKAKLERKFGATFNLESGLYPEEWARLPDEFFSEN